MSRESLKATLDEITGTMGSGEDLRGVVEQLVNVVEQLYSELEKARERIRYLEGELEKRKRGKGSGSGSGSDPGSGKSGAKGTDHSSEKRRKGNGGADGQSKPARRGRTSKSAVEVHETRRCELDRSTLPADAQFKGLDCIVVRDIILREWNVEFQREVYYSPSEGKRYMALPPEGWRGEFGPTLRMTVVTLKYDAQTSEPGIVRFFGGHGIRLSSGSVSNILLSAGEFFQAERIEILCQGYMSQGHAQSDDTAARVMGEYWHTHVVCNDYFTAYFTRAGKDRMTVIDVLLGRTASQRLYRYTALTAELLEIFEVSGKQRDALSRLVEEGRDYDEETMSALLREQFGEKAGSAEAAARIREAMALGYFHEQDEIPFPETLLTDCHGRAENWGK